MLIEIPDQHLILYCGGQPGIESAVNLGVIVKSYLYANPRYTTQNKIALGGMLVAALEKQLSE